MLKITILCTDVEHPIYIYLEQWKISNSLEFEITLINNINEIVQGGDILFLISCSQIVTSNIRNIFNNTLVLHASDLPKGRGWSPHIWDIIEGENTITLSLLEAEDSVDTGDIWKKTKIYLDGSELYNEINDKLFKAELDLIMWACNHNSDCVPEKQVSDNSTYRKKRTPRDSRLDVLKSIEEQFNLLRVCDPDRFPAFFIKDGKKYNVKIERDSE